jgi:hypothetical protein
VNRRQLRARVTADLAVVHAEHDSTCSLILTFPDADGCTGVISAGSPHVALVELTGLAIHRYCVPCARNLYDWPR